MVGVYVVDMRELKLPCTGEVGPSVKPPSHTFVWAWLMPGTLRLCRLRPLADQKPALVVLGRCGVCV